MHLLTHDLMSELFNYDAAVTWVLLVLIALMFYVTVAFLIMLSINVMYVMEVPLSGSVEVFCTSENTSPVSIVVYVHV